MPDASIHRALELAEIQISHLSAGDFESYLAGASEYSELCDSISKFSARDLNASGPELARLVDADRQIVERLAQLKAQVGERLGLLTLAGKATNAYHPGISSLPVSELRA